MIEIPKPGQEVFFNGVDGKMHGIVNGDAINLVGGEVYIPVHVREGNQNIMVHVSNIVKVEA